MWRKNLNIQSEVKLLEQAEFFNQYYSVKYKDMAATGIIGPAMEPHSFVWDATHSTSPKNYWNIKDPKNDEFALKQRRELDTEKRKQILLEWFKYDTDNVTRMWIINVYRLSARHPYVYNAADEVDAWEPGWGSKVRDKVWKDV
jgi:ABC-type transport system substrate-binding protein